MSVKFFWGTNWHQHYCRHWHGVEQATSYYLKQWRSSLRPRCVTKPTLQCRHDEHDGVSNHQPSDCLLNQLFRDRSKKTSKLCIIDLCVGNSPVTGEFPTQRASNTQNVFIWWRHHEMCAKANKSKSCYLKPISKQDIISYKFSQKDLHITSIKYGYSSHSPCFIHMLYLEWHRVEHIKLKYWYDKYHI